MNCAVAGCRNIEYVRDATKCSYFRFPRNLQERKKWIRFCRRKKSFDPGPSATICMEHFTPDAFQNTLQFEMGLAQKRLLKRGAIPTLFVTSKENKREIDRKKRREKRENKKLVKSLLEEYTKKSIKDENEEEIYILHENNPEHAECQDLETFDKEDYDLIDIQIDAVQAECQEELQDYEKDSSNVSFVSYENDDAEIEKVLLPKFESYENYEYLQDEPKEFQSYDMIRNSDEYVELEMEYETLKEEAEYLREENTWLRKAEKKCLKRLALMKKINLMKQRRANREYSKLKSKYECEIEALKKRLEKAESENRTLTYLHILA